MKRIGNQIKSLVKEKTITHLVAREYRVANILQECGIDIFSGAKMTLKEYCCKAQVDLSQVVSRLGDEQALKRASYAPFDSWPLDFLCCYIVKRHHEYAYENITILCGLIEKLDNVSDYTIGKVCDVFKRMARDMKLHMMKEENILFPFIEQMVEASRERIQIARPFFGTVNNPTQIMEIEHEHSWEDISLIRTLTDNYNIKGNADPKMAILCRGLEQFEMDLVIHLDLENNILFPKAILLEKQLGVS